LAILKKVVDFDKNVKINHQKSSKEIKSHQKDKT